MAGASLRPTTFFEVQIMFSSVLLTVDFDRTLTAPDSTIPQRNIDAIEDFMAKGGAFTVNTGRSVPMIAPYADSIPVNAPLLLYNGSAAYDWSRKEFAFAREIDLPMWDTIRALIRDFPDLTVELQGVDAHYTFSENKPWEAYCRHNGCAFGYAKEGDDVGPFLKLALYGTFHDVTVADMYRGSAEELARMDQVERLLNEKYGDFCEIFRACPRIIDIHAKNVSKANIARDLQKQLGRATLVCVGDGENDISMLNDADFAYCPGDAIVKDRYENVCDCAEGAVADVIFEKIPPLVK